jgi:hypothetical protein
VCIDQNNLVEKAAQVRQMLPIFARAEKVIAWLGESNEAVDHVLDQAKGLTSSGRITNTSDITPKTAQHADEYQEDVVRGILSRSYWRRTWVRQEVYAARSILLQFGQRPVDFDAFVAFVDMLGMITPQLEGLLSGNKLGKTDARFLESKEAVVPRVFAVLGESQLFDVSDERDRVYGLLGMMGMEQFSVDYTMSISTVYESFTKYLIASTGDLSCLDVCGIRPWDGHRPSWCLDWSSSYDCFTKMAFDMTQPLLFRPRKDTIIPVSALICVVWRGRWNNLPSRDNMDELSLLGYRLGLINQHLPIDAEILRGKTPQRHKWEFLRNLDVSRHMQSFLEKGKLKLALIGERQRPPLRRRVYEAVFSEAQMAGGVVVAAGAKDGDVVVQLLRSRMLHVLRPAARPGKFSLVCAGWFWIITRPRIQSILSRSKPLNDTGYESAPLDTWMRFGFTADANVFAHWAKIYRVDGEFERRIVELFGTQIDTPSSKFAPDPEEQESRGRRTAVETEEIIEPELFVLV